MNRLTVSPSPHVHSGDSVKKNMYGVIIALVPALAASLYYFGLGAAIVTITAVLSCVFFEWAIQKFLLKTEATIMDGSAALTGLLLAFNMPSNLPIWIIIIGSLVAIGIGKMSFGGLGNNPFNPALVGRIFLLISFPVQMTLWPKPIASQAHYLDAETGATPLSIMKEGLANGESVSSLMNHVDMPSIRELFFGLSGGSAGEVAAAALLIGLIFMLIRKIITWHIPVAVIGSIAVFTGILNLVSPEQFAGPLFHLLTGGVMLGAIFMATDYVSSPMANKGMIIYGIGIGVITVVIRVFGAYPEGVSFAILIMNGFVPLIDKYVKPKRFGEVAKPAKA
ncbi:RnfABCDGE type electron transport complex subunit D [Carboxylicivirga marina]|uniref:Ion-translocating oxidoreductase complex subunit D n=1 Tax=Carboxylicivirga marina TaxID=2800988 RepID=A0ABS1HHW6_9BACT|nr:RnfABCDGE type electron transport complex subunit D [Carboxylicivirga marina]MBK3517065.1 RnfABCDGE type electron transport complex subunit D [Carboxylicivirga marina]